VIASLIYLSPSRTVRMGIAAFTSYNAAEEIVVPATTSASWLG
jgi:hypothetical protein